MTATTLAMEGFRDFYLTDFDVLSCSNLNRLASSLTRVGTQKAILVPLTMMVWEPEHLPLPARLVVCLGFGSGVLLLFRYLFVYAAVLGPHSERTVMPTHVTGLLAPTRRRARVTAP